MTQNFNKKELKDRRRELRKGMTFCEKILWKHLRRKQMKVRFLRQFSVDAYVIDFYSPKIKLAIEVDGEVHDTIDQKDYDKVRQSYIEGFNISFFRIKNEDLLRNPNKVFELLRQKIDEMM